MTKDLSETIWIPLADGRRLSARVWLPDATTPSPVILEYLPYRKRDATAPRDETTHRLFAQNGYAGVRVDIAGTGDSEGVFDDEYSEQELSDGEAVISWISAQPWCDGKIGMIGISWGGFNGLQLAYRRPPALKAVVSVASTVDRYEDDIHFMGGCLLTDNANWGTQFSSMLWRPSDPELREDWRDEWMSRMENSPNLSALWMGHQSRSDYWKHGSICEDWSAVDIPILAITGWADPYVNTPPAIVANLKTPSKALIGPWEHKYSHLSQLGASDFHGEVLRWFDRWLKEEDNGAENLPDYRFFVQEHFDPTAQTKPRQGRWSAEQDWPSPNTQDEIWPLAPGGFAPIPTAGKLSISSKCDVGRAGGYFCPGMRLNNELPGDQVNDDAKSVCFDSSALNEPMELLGRPRVKIKFSVDKPVAQLAVRLCDVSPEGVSQRVSFKPFNLTHYKSNEWPETLVPGEVYEADIHLNECAHVLRAGHRLRLAVSTSYWPLIWPSPENASVDLYLEDCALHLPVRKVSQEIDPVAPGSAQDYPRLEFSVIRPTDCKSQEYELEDGTIVLEIFDDFGATRDPYHGMATSSYVKTRYSIHPDNPTSARFETKWDFSMDRGDWKISVETESVMQSDNDNFYLNQKMRASEGTDETEVLKKEWSETLPRGFL